ncbi:hypothetical protein vseg_000443 [Gypsophila vaccaria]
MANFNMSLLLLSSFVLLLSFNFGNTSEIVPVGMKAWCVAKPSSSEAELQSNIDYVCGQSRIACNIIQQGGQCYAPNSLINHASVVMNLYFQKYGHDDHTCSFKNSGIIVLTDPSYGNCLYPYIQ